MVVVGGVTMLAVRLSIDYFFNSTPGEPRIVRDFRIYFYVDSVNMRYFGVHRLFFSFLAKENNNSIIVF